MVDQMDPERGLPRAERIKLRVGTVAWFLGLGGLLLGLPVLLDIGWIAVLVIAILSLLLALPLSWFVRRLFIGQRRQGRIHVLLKSLLGALAALTILVAAPIYALAIFTAVSPLVVPQAKLSNGSKDVVFQGMIHVGSEGFYKSVVYDVEQALSEGYTIFYEGVTSDPAGDAWFSQTLAGGGDLSTNYTAMGDACGLVFQLNYFELLETDKAQHPERHVAADVSTADMMREYQRLEAVDPQFAARVGAESKPAAQSGENGGGGFTQLLTWLQEATPGQRDLVGIACRGWMSWLLGQRSAPSALDPVILDFRNRELAKRIQAGPGKIFITYGAGHLPGLLIELQALDANWALGSVKWMRGIDTPETLEGQIQ